MAKEEKNIDTERNGINKHLANSIT